MATWLKQSTAAEIKIGPFLDDTDGKTAETGLSITQPDIRLAKNGAAWAQKNASQTLSHEENGWYEIALDSTDTNTLGALIVNISKAGALPVWREFLVVPANVYDSVVGGSDYLDVSAVEIEGADATDTIGSAAATGVWGAGARTLTAGTNIALAKGTGVTGFNDLDAAGVRGAVGLASANLDTQLSGINTKTTNLPASPAAVSDIPSAASIATAVWGAVTRTLSAGTNIALAKGVGVTGFTDLDAAGVRTAVGLASANLDTQLSGINSKTTNLPASPAATGDIPSAATIASTVWASVIEGSYTAVQFMRGFGAALFGKSTGLDGTSPKFRDTGDTKDRISATTDGKGDRSAVTLNLT